MSVLRHSSLIRTCSLYRSLVTPVQRALSTAVDQEPAVLLETVGTAGVVTLNRPKQLNAMNYQMWKLLLPQLQDWEKSCSRLIIKGSGNAFSAGGDVEWVSSADPDPRKNAFGIALFNSLYLLSKYGVPYIALMDGITFGAGCTLALNSRYRVATERTVVATPETRIGWITDCCATYLLPRLHNHLGIYMGLTGKRIEGKDVAQSGLATHFVPSACLQKLQSDLCYCNIEDIEDRINAYSEPLGQFSLAPIMRDIDYCFSADTIEEIIERLLKVDNSWSKETVKTLAQMCPTTLKVSLRALQYGKVSDIKQCLRTEYRMLVRIKSSYNAQEGVRALLVDKGRKPEWQPATLAEVSDSMVDSYFDPLPAGEELPFFDDFTIRILGALTDKKPDKCDSNSPIEGSVQTDKKPDKCDSNSPIEGSVQISSYFK